MRWVDWIQRLAFRLVVLSFIVHLAVTVSLQFYPDHTLLLAFDSAFLVMFVASLGVMIVSYATVRIMKRRGAL